MIPVPPSPLTLYFQNGNTDITAGLGSNSFVKVRDNEGERG